MIVATTSLALRGPRSPATARQAGRLIYLIGASGSGKDSLLNWLTTALPTGTAATVRIARRAITRAESGNESAMALTPEAFALRCAAGEFALYWHSHGLDYGIGVEIDEWLDRGDVVIVNGSRAYLAQAYGRYPSLEAVEIVVSPDTLRQRLLARGRESLVEIDARLKRAVIAFPTPPGCRLMRMANDGTLDTAGKALLDFVLR